MGRPYDTTAWRKLSKQLRAERKACEVCGFRAPRREVHHLYGVKNDPEHKHLLVLCKGCHEVLTILTRRSRNKLTQAHLRRLHQLAHLYFTGLSSISSSS